MDYPNLFTPASIGTLTLKNRVIMGPMGTAMADSHHNPTALQAAHYAHRARAGVGMVVVEHTSMQLVGSRSAKASGIWSWDAVDKWRAVVDGIHSGGAKAAIQIGHQGHSTDYSRLLGQVAQSASPVRCHLIQEETRGVTLEEMEQFKADYVNSVKIAIAAGFDAVMLHCTNGYFLASWLSGRTNKRTDRYGGNLENRMRFPLELIAQLRREIGRDYPLIVRLAAREPNHGRELEETRVIAQAMERAGIDALDINAGSWSDYDWEFPSYYQPEGFLLEADEKIRASVSIPVIGGGRILEPRMAEDALAQGRVDFISVTRALLADPEWLTKAQRGEEESIRRCIGCTRCINDREHGGLICSVNPFERHEEEWAVTPAPHSKRILVVGGGPGGLQAASICARRGHQVILAEAKDDLGGMIRAAGVPPLKWGILGVVTALAYDAQKAGARILLRTPVDLAWIRANGPFDHILLATGAQPAVPPIPVSGSLQPKTAVDVLLGQAWVGKRVAILGGGMIGCETAEFLAEYRKEVTVFELLPQVAGDLYWNIRDNLLSALDELHVKRLTGARVQSVEADGWITYLQDGECRRAGPFDDVLFSVGMKPDLSLARALEDAGYSPLLIGDAAGAGRLQETLTSAVEATIHL